MTAILAATEETRTVARAKVRENIRRLGELGQRNLEAVLAELQSSRDRLVARLATGTEFDVARSRGMIVAIDAEVRLLRERLGSPLARGFVSALRNGDEDIADQAREVLPSTDAFRVSTGVSSHLIDTATGRSADLVGQISESLRADLNALMRRAATGTNRPADVAREIGAVLDEAGRPVGIFGTKALQIEKVHRTETSSLYETAAKARALTVARESPWVMLRTWITIKDGRERVDHADMNGATVEVGESFNYGAGRPWCLVSYEQAQRDGGTLGLACDGPHDAILPAEAAVNCRCSTGLRRGQRKETTR
jgi:hypothetical protein